MPVGTNIPAGQNAGGSLVQQANARNHAAHIGNSLSNTTRRARPRLHLQSIDSAYELVLCHWCIPSLFLLNQACLVKVDIFLLVCHLFRHLLLLRPPLTRGLEDRTLQSHLSEVSFTLFFNPYVQQTHTDKRRVYARWCWGHVHWQRRVECSISNGCIRMFTQQSPRKSASLKEDLTTG